MEIKKNILQRHLHEIAIEQLCEEYISKGYTVAREVNMGEFEADIIATKGNDTLIIEVKAGKMTPEKRNDILKISEFVKQKENHKFKLVVATPPKEKKIEIFDLEELFTQNFIQELPDELHELSTHSRVEDVSNIEIEEITVTHEAEVLAKGFGIVNVDLQYGSDGDQDSGHGFTSSDNFPFDFEIVLAYDDKKKLVIDQIVKLSIDTSSFYGASDD